MDFLNPIQKAHLQVKINKSSKTFIMNVLSKWGFEIWRKIEPNKSEKIRNEKTWAYPWTFLRVWLNLESRLVRVLSFFLWSSGLLLLLLLVFLMVVAMQKPCSLFLFVLVFTSPYFCFLSRPKNKKALDQKKEKNKKASTTCGNNNQKKQMMYLTLIMIFYMYYWK